MQQDRNSVTDQDRRPSGRGCWQALDWPPAALKFAFWGHCGVLCMWGAWSCIIWGSGWTLVCVPRCVLSLAVMMRVRQWRGEASSVASLGYRCTMGIFSLRGHEVWGSILVTLGCHILCPCCYSVSHYPGLLSGNSCPELLDQWKQGRQQAITLNCAAVLICPVT